MALNRVGDPIDDDKPERTVRLMGPYVFSIMPALSNPKLCDSEHFEEEKQWMPTTDEIDMKLYYSYHNDVEKSATWDNVWRSNLVDKISLRNVKIIYMDNSEETYSEDALMIESLNRTNPPPPSPYTKYGDDDTNVRYDRALDFVANHALEFVSNSKQASASLLNKAFIGGYSDAVRIIELLEREGVISPSGKDS